MNVKETRKNRRYVPNLSADLESCDANYIRFLQLFPNHHTLDALVFAVSLGEREVDVDIKRDRAVPLHDLCYDFGHGRLGPTVLVGLAATIDLFVP